MPRRTTTTTAAAYANEEEEAAAAAAAMRADNAYKSLTKIYSSKRGSQRKETKVQKWLEEGATVRGGLHN